MLFILAWQEEKNQWQRADLIVTEKASLTCELIYPSMKSGIIFQMNKSRNYKDCFDKFIVEMLLQISELTKSYKARGKFENILKLIGTSHS